MAAKPAETAEESPEGGFSTRGQRWVALDSPAKVRLALAAVVRATLDGVLDYRTSAAATTGLRALREAIHDDELDARLTALERQRERSPLEATQ